MPEDRIVADEIAALRAEIEELKSERAKWMRKDAEEASERAEPTATRHEVEPTKSAHDQLEEFEIAVGRLSETLEEEISERPVIAVGAALLLGILIGRLSAR
jgi:ElaB/YqjD/DUF883 family membrane-anchored ribosome-binding protein